MTDPLHLNSQQIEIQTDMAQRWNELRPDGLRSVNGKNLEQIGHSPFEILHGHLPGGALVSEDYHKMMGEVGVVVLNAPSTSRQSVGLVEVFNKSFQDIFP